MVHREANVLLNERGGEFAEALTAGTASHELDSAIEGQVQEILSDIDHLEDVMKWSELREPAPPLWRSAETWQGVMIGAAMAALAHDVRACASRILMGQLPRLRNVQVD